MKESDSATANDLRIDVRVTDKIGVVTLAGALDSYTKSRLETRLNQLFKRRIYNLLIDCAQLDYISCAGIGLLLHKHSIAKRRGGNIALTRPSSNVRTTLNLFGIPKVITVANSLSHQASLISLMNN